MKTTLHNDSHADAQQTRHWSTAKQAKRVSEYCSRWKIWAVALIVTTSGVQAAVAPSGNLLPGSTLYLGTASGAVSGIENQLTTVWGPQSGSAFAVTETRASSTSGTCTTASNIVTTSDGYTGLFVGNDIVLGITGTATGTTAEATPTYVTGTWTTTGGFSVIGTSPGVWCAPNPINVLNVYISGRAKSAAFNGTAFIHAGPLASPGTYTTRGIELRIQNGNSQFSTYSGPSTLVLPGRIYVGSSECTTSFADPMVNFGTVQQNSTDTQVLGYFQSALNINCSAVADSGTGSGTAAMTLSFSGTKGRYTDTVALQGTEGQGNLAEVRGVRATGTGSCDNNPDRIQFQGQQYSVGNVGVGQTSVPLTWSLCSNGSGLKGVGTAQATATLTWP